jgi:signal transduction histidine kinase
MGQDEARGWRRLLAAAPEITDLGERRGSQLVALVAIVLFGLTTLGLIVGYVAAPAVFWPRLPLVSLLLASHALTYGLNRTRYHRVAAFLLCLGPIWSNLFVGLGTPEDPIWYGFMSAGVLLASILLSFRAALLIGALGAVAAGSVVFVHGTPLGAGRDTLIVAYVVIFTAVVLAMARFRSWVESGRRSELLHLERQLAANQRMEAVGRLAASVAHDFNNFLMVIQANVELARLRPGTQSLDDIGKAAERASALTEQLLAFARQQPRKPVVLSLDAVIHNLEPILTRLVGSRVKLALSLDARWSIEADAVQLEQVLVNLASNARDAMPDGGVLAIATLGHALRDGTGLPAGDYVMLTVTDSGHGMDAATRERAFEPFFTTKARGKGSGLGLATVRGIVDQSGGRIEIETELGHGTTFRILLPAAAPSRRGEPALLPVQGTEAAAD